MYAAQNGHKDVVDTLLQHGASVDLTTKVSAVDLESQYLQSSNSYNCAATPTVYSGH